MRTKNPIIEDLLTDIALHVQTLKHKPAFGDTYLDAALKLQDAAQWLADKGTAQDTEDAVASIEFVLTLMRRGTWGEVINTHV